MERDRRGQNHDPNEEEDPNLIAELDVAVEEGKRKLAKRHQIKKAQLEEMNIKIKKNGNGTSI